MLDYLLFYSNFLRLHLSVSESIKLIWGMARSAVGSMPWAGG